MGLFVDKVLAKNPLLQLPGGPYLKDAVVFKIDSDINSLMDIKRASKKTKRLFETIEREFGTTEIALREDGEERRIVYLQRPPKEHDTPEHELTQQSCPQEIIADPAYRLPFSNLVFDFKTFCLWPFELEATGDPWVDKTVHVVGMGLNIFSVDLEGRRIWVWTNDKEKHYPEALTKADLPPRKDFWGVQYFMNSTTGMINLYQARLYCGDGFFHVADLVNAVAIVELVTKLCALIHCINVRRVKHAPPYPLVKKRLKRGKPPLVSYYTLEVKPSPISENKEKQGLWENRVHLCRGHYKRYTAERPLLGRHVGMWWWQPSVRGRNKKGMVIKDYSVKANPEVSHGLA
jgi:hypothetical protein